MSIQLEELYQKAQTLPLLERLQLINRLLADLKADLELKEELTGWDHLSDEALALFEQNL